MAISLFKPTLRRKDMDNVLSCMVGDLIGPGKYSHEFISALAHYLQSAGGVALASYYSSLLLSLDILKLEPGDKVIISPLSPSIYLDVLEAKKLKPLFIDVDPDSAVIATDELHNNYLKQAKAVLLHYTLGFVPNLAEIRECGIPIIEDISQGLGAQWEDVNCGGIGDVTVVSLDQNNIITTGSGGVVLVKNKHDYRFLKRVLEMSPEYSLLPDINAAIGLAQLKQISVFLDTRKEIASFFSKALMRSKHSTLVQKNSACNVYYSFPVMVSQSMMEVRKFAKKQHIETHAAFNESVITRYDEIYNTYPNAKTLLLRCVLFPLYPSLGKKNVEEISKVLAVLP
ncbi:MAG: DegT/DnrJ/EryC1/StrS aminotransferase family protein [Spirochaetales bacterium]|nr:DegT/DnrJ/EryC1/StrS aminotransferase family protein [Spirochaetales bacterium]